MSDKNSVIIKTILDKTGITKGIREVQSFLNRNPLKLHTKFDTKEIQKQLQAAMNKTEKQLAQKQNKISGEKSSPQIVESASTKSNSRQIARSTSPPKTTSDNRGGLIRLINSFPFLATAGFSSDAYETCH